MKNSIVILAVAALIAGFSGKTMAQDNGTAGHAINYTLPSMHIMNLQNTVAKPVLTFLAPATAGAKIAAVTNELSWINVTSIITTGKTKTIQVSRTGTIPAGTTLTVIAAAASANGNGSFGTPVGTAVDVTTTGTGQDLITGIGSCWTDAGVGMGYKLTYNWSVDAAYATGLVAAASATAVTLTYTISETL